MKNKYCKYYDLKNKKFLGEGYFKLYDDDKFFEHDTSTNTVCIKQVKYN